VIWGADGGADIKLHFFGDEAAFKALGKERAIALCNHGSDIDWLLGWMVALRAGVLGYTRCLLKEVLSFVPFLGPSFYFSEYIFVSRSWEKDFPRLKKMYSTIANTVLPYWLVIYAEGTRSTPEKQAASQAYSREHSLPVFNNVLYPRTKGFCLAVDELRGSTEAILACTLAFPGEPPTVSDIFANKSVDIHVHISKYDAKEVGTTHAEMSEFCVKVYAEMDRLLEQYKINRTFPGKEKQLAQPTTPALVVFFWAVITALMLALSFGPSILAGDPYAAAILIGLLTIGDVMSRVMNFFSRIGKKSRKAKKAAQAAAESTSTTVNTPTTTATTEAAVVTQTPVAAVVKAATPSVTSMSSGLVVSVSSSSSTSTSIFEPTAPASPVTVDAPVPVPVAIVASTAIPAPQAEQQEEQPQQSQIETVVAETATPVVASTTSTAAPKKSKRLQANTD
jgi:lysophosphatidic acid acyltransferase/lysophosphatidylinositol acyltransferase